MNDSIKYVVGIGASAGGLEAIQEFFNYMPKKNNGLTIIVVQHLSPDFKSMMSELLAHNTSTPIIIVKNNMILQAGVIYLIPATFEAKIEENRFKLIKLNRKSLMLPINTLFKSIAIAYGQLSIGIILSGTGADGSLGMMEIARNNGLTIVQSPTEAKFRDMPTHAIATGEINCVLFVSEMPDVIMEYINQPSEFNKSFKQIEAPSKAEYGSLFLLLQKKYNIDFSSYKIGTVSRRIRRRMKLLSMDSLQAYFDYLTQDEAALKILYQDLLIGVTAFFRDAEAFETLEADVIPELFTQFKKTHEDIRIWVNPCATGEEAYSIAILFKKYAEEHNLPFAVKIFASDVSIDFIKKAKKGYYSYESVEYISPDLLNKYFIKSNDYYEIIPEIRQKVLFTTHNLLQDPPFTKMDLVCCRNLLIYINPKEQKRITDLLRFSLNLGGFLFLGPSESLSMLAPDLIVKNQLWKIFNKIKRSNFPQISTTRLAHPSAKDRRVSSSNHVPFGALPLYAYNAILHDVVSSGFIIDKSYAILHSIGTARELLMLPEGVPTLILPKIIIKDLKGALITALHQAEKSMMPVIYDNIVIHQSPGKEHVIKMAVHPIFDTTNKISYYWIRLDPATVGIKKKANIIKISSFERDAHDNEVIISLEGELSEARVLLQASLENTETINEEMQSTNEELMASNEELQSSNEELQSVNEELYTVNLERTKKIEEVMLAKTDIDNLIRGAEICTIILNDQLEIRIFTPAIGKIFNLVSHDIGRPLRNFIHQLKFDLLMKKVEEVLENDIVYEDEVRDNQNYWYFLKILPYYSAHQQSITGVVITLTDIHDTKLLQQKKEQIERELRLALKTGLIGIWRYSFKDNNFNYDETIKNIFGLTNLSSMNQLKLFFSMVHSEDRKRIENAFEVTRSTNADFEEKFRVRRPDKRIRYLSCSANVHHDNISDSNYIIGICWDMTEQYWLEEKIINSEHLNLGLDAITEGWWDWNLMTNQVYLSPLRKKTLGFEDHELPNNMESYEHLMFPEDRKILNQKMEKYIASNSTQPMIQKIRMKHKNGSYLWILSRRKGILNKHKKMIRIIGTVTDITDLKENEAILAQLAYRDCLTKLPNRSYFMDGLLRAIGRAKRTQNIFALMFVDIDDFKEINDRWGHSVGDLVLFEFSNRLMKFSRTVDLVARLGGDEFGIILEDIGSSDEIRTIATRYISAYSEPLKIDGMEIVVQVSIGIALYPEHGKKDQSILTHADKNMYIAKKQGKNQFVLD